MELTLQLNICLTSLIFFVMLSWQINAAWSLHGWQTQPTNLSSYMYKQLKVVVLTGELAESYFQRMAPCLDELSGQSCYHQYHYRGDCQTSTGLMLMKIVI